VKVTFITLEVKADPTGLLSDSKSVSIIFKEAQIIYQLQKRQYYFWLIVSIILVNQSKTSFLKSPQVQLAGSLETWKRSVWFTLHMVNDFYKTVKPSSEVTIKITKSKAPTFGDGAGVEVDWMRRSSSRILHMSALVPTLSLGFNSLRKT